jgi:hypothetical protein
VRWEDLNIEKVYVNTVAKVGSSAFLHSLKGAEFNVHHGHSLELLRKVFTQESNCLIVSGIRNPLDRNISYFFQTCTDNFYNDVKTKKNGYKGENCFVMERDEFNKISPIQIINIYFSQKWHYTFNDWFYEFFEITKIDFYEFDKDLGIGLYNLPNNNYLLFYVFEKLSSNIPFIESFFGITELAHTNNSEDRVYRDQYRKVKSLIKIPQSYKDKLLLTSIMNNFYKKEEIATFFEKY